MNFDNHDIKVAWLDLDDTVIDFLTNSRRALERLWSSEPLLTRHFASASQWVDVYEHHNHQLWDQYSRGLIDRSFLRMERFRRPIMEGGAPELEARKASERYDTLYLDYLAQERMLIPGSIDLLRFLRQRGVTIGCLSNGFKDVQYRKIRNCGLEPWFDIVVLSDDIGVNKPHPDIYRHAMECSGHLSPESHLMIGDNPLTDIAGALNAGWSAIHFLRTPDTLPAKDCRFAVNDLTLIPDLIDGASRH